MHRAENVDDENRLNNIINALSDLKETNIIFPIHPRTRKNLKYFGLWDKLNEINHVHIINPLNYLDFLLLISYSKLVLTDSGGLQEESITLNTPALTLRYNTERQETVDAGGNILVGADKNIIVKNVRKILNNNQFAENMQSAINPYGKGNTAQKIIEKAYKKDLLDIQHPENMMPSFKRKITNITEKITVQGFEKKNNSLIHLAYDGEKMIFPHNKLNIQGMMITYDQYQNLKKEK